MTARTDCAARPQDFWEWLGALADSSRMSDRWNRLAAMLLRWQPAASVESSERLEQARQMTVRSRCSRRHSRRGGLFHLERSTPDPCGHARDGVRAGRLAVEELRVHGPPRPTGRPESGRASADETLDIWCSRTSRAAGHRRSVNGIGAGDRLGLQRGWMAAGARGRPAQLEQGGARALPS
jgi:hypothetical protein